MLVTDDGRAVQCRVAGQSHDNFGEGGTQLWTEYEFYVDNSDYRARTTIQWSARR